MQIIREKPLFVYKLLLNFSGTALFFIALFYSAQQQSLDLNQWIMIYAMSGAVVLLYHWLILLVPSGHGFSMDSSLFLASIFYFGLYPTLIILIISSVFYWISQQLKKTSVHLINFSINSFALISAYFVFLVLNGQFGSLDPRNIFPYVAALVAFMMVNTVLVAIYVSLVNNENFKSVIKSMLFAGVSSTYSINLILAIILFILISTYQIFGLFLFVTIAVLLSVVFKRYYEYYIEVQMKANKDHLTGLFNHGYFEGELEYRFKQAKEQEASLSLVLIDVDDFKKFNDTYGHSKGDQLLKFIGEILLEGCRPHKDWLVARYGGEEFTIILPGVEQQEAFRYMNNLRKKLNDSYFEGVEILPYGCISFSAGISQFEKDMYDKSKLLDSADKAMYYAKGQGKNQVRVYNEDIQFENMIDDEKEIERLEQSLSFFLAKDVYTYQHSKRVYQYAIGLSEILSLSSHEKKTLILGALIHDIGKIEVPRDVLSKRGKLTNEEWSLIKKHVTWGKDIVAQHKQLHHLLPLVELHHERYDGRGYPHGLKGTNIPKLARILCIIDSFDAMTTERPYQKTKTFEEGIEELRRCAGEQFDPYYVDPFIEMIEMHYIPQNSNTYSS